MEKCLVKEKDGRTKRREEEGRRKKSQERKKEKRRRERFSFTFQRKQITSEVNVA